MVLPVDGCRPGRRDVFVGRVLRGGRGGSGIEPVEEDAAILVVGEAAVEFVAQGARETGDFSFA